MSHSSTTSNQNVAGVGLQWGDEGKIVNVLTDQADVVVRFNLS